jgi:putative acetyltransferase
VTAVLAEFGLQSEPQGVDADLLDIEQHYRANGGEFWVVLHEGRLVGTGGFIMTSPGQAELRKMYLTPVVRGRGLGRTLLELIESVAAARGALRMTLETASVLQDAIRLYERNGYRPSCGQASASRCDRHYSKTLAPDSGNQDV